MLPLWISGPGSDGNEEVLPISQISKAGVSSSDWVHSTAPTDWAEKVIFENAFTLFIQLTHSSIFLNISSLSLIDQVLFFLISFLIFVLLYHYSNSLLISVCKIMY